MSPCKMDNVFITNEVPNQVISCHFRTCQGWIVAECLALPGCVSQSQDEQETLSNIKEAITVWLWAYASKLK
jgi:hypothetical protein